MNDTTENRENEVPAVDEVMQPEAHLLVKRFWNMDPVSVLESEYMKERVAEGWVFHSFNVATKPNLGVIQNQFVVDTWLVMVRLNQ